MSPRRVKERWGDFQNALKRLDEALKEDLAKSSAIIDGTIQRFVVAFESAWKLGRDILDQSGTVVHNPRSVIKELFQECFIQNGEEWIQMLEARERTVDIYDEKDARAVYEQIKEN